MAVQGRRAEGRCGMRECMASRDFPDDILSGSVDEAAVGLLGCLLIREFEDGGVVVARIVETEAYDQDDPASHAFHGKSERNAALFGPAGHAYVYISYGMHRCFNISAGDDGFGAGALIRAVEPVRGIGIMRERRFANRSGSRAIIGNRKDVDLTNGPAKLCQAMGIDLSLYGHDMSVAPLYLERRALLEGEHIAASPRIGISKAVERLRRFFIVGNPYVTKSPLNRRGRPLAG